MSSAIDALDPLNTALELASPAYENEPPAVLPVTVIERKPGWQVLDLGELWRYRELLFILTWRDVKVRYKQTILGAAWAILQPLATMMVFSLFFGRVAGVSRRATVPYPLFVFAGLLPWMFLFQPRSRRPARAWWAARAW